jgi:hypothetical protein
MHPLHTFCPATKSMQKAPNLYVLFRRLFGNGRHAIACALHDKARLLFLKIPRLTKLKAKRIALKNPKKHLISLNKKRLSADEVIKASNRKRPAFRRKIRVVSTKAKSRSIFCSR